MSEGVSDTAPLEAQLPTPPQEIEEEDVCRVCRVEGDEEMPLIYPCKCSGSVRYVHPDWSWLAASQKKHCEICGYAYNFTKVYPDYIPPTIPVTVYIRQTSKWIIEISRRIFRLWLASNAWLVLLPALNMSSMRTLLWATDFLSPSPPSADMGNSTISANDTITPSLGWDNETRIAVTYMFSHPVSAAGFLAKDSWTRWNAGEQDTAIGYVFRGQLLTVTLAAIILGLVLIREWMAQHVMSDTVKPPVLGPINTDNFVVINGIAYDNRLDAFLAYAYDASMTPAQNLMLKKEYKRAKNAMYSAIVKGKKESVRLSDIQTFSRGNPLIASTFIKGQVAQDIMNADPSQTLGSLRRGVRDDALLSAHIDALLNRFMAAKAGSTRGSLESKGSLVDWNNGSSDEEKDRWASEKWPKSASNSFEFAKSDPALPASIGPADPSADSPDLTTTPPRPVNADDSGFDEHVSYTAPELLDTNLNVPRFVATSIEYIPAGTTESRHQERLARLREERKRKWEAKIARVPIGTDEDGEDQEGWVTDDSNTAESSKAGPSRQTARARNNQIRHDDPRFKEIAEAFGLNRPRQPFATASDGGRDQTAESSTEAQRQHARATLAALRGESSDMSGEPPTMPSPARNDNSDDDGSSYPARVDEPSSATWPTGGPDRPDLRDDVDLQPVGRDEDDADDDADDDEGEDDQEDPQDAPLHIHDVGDPEGLDHDDWDGVLEVIGLIGPVQNLAQNVCFGFIIIGASMSILAGIPIWIGRIFLSIDYWHSAKYSSTLVFQGTRLIFDPLIRLVYEIIAKVVVLPAVSSIKALEKIVADSAGLGETSLPKLNWTSAIPPVMRETATIKAGDLFATIGQTAQTYASTVYQAHGTWSAEVLGTGTLPNRLWTMAYGYGIILAVILFIALNPAGFRGQAGGSLSGQVQDTAQYAKLAFFMFAELVIFPSMIGMVIQVCIIPITPYWSMDTLLQYFREVPFGAMFLTWILGTSFMFVFAGVLQTLRKMCRKGVLFFIRDPSEQSYNPVKDILERPTTSQMRKLGISAIMYTIVAMFLFGATCWTLTISPLKRLELLPLRTTAFKSISTVPLDLLFYAIAAGPTLRSFRFGNRGRRWMRRWWDSTAVTFNLTNLLTGQDRSNQAERPAVLRVWRAVDVVGQLVLGRYDNSATWARVPAADNVVLLKPDIRKGRGVFVRLDRFGQPVTPEGKLLLLQQNQAAVAVNRDPKADYKTVWLPQYWRTRVHAVIATALVLCGSLIAFATFAPLIVGRMLLDRAFGEPVHDGYNWLTGVYILWGTYHLAKAVRQTILLSQLASRLRRSNASTRVKRAFTAALARVYVLAVLYLIIPIVVGIQWELYIAMPFRYGFKSYTPVLHFWEAWAMGLVLVLTYVAITHDSDHDVRRPGRPKVLGQQMRECYRTSFSTDASTVHGSTFAFIGFMVGIDIAPSLVAIIPAYLYRNQGDINAFSVVYRFAHPALLALLIAFLCRKAIMRRWSALRQLLIDAEYVIEERVENYEPGKKQKVKSGEGSNTFEGSGDDDDDDDGETWEDVDVAGAER